MNLCRATESISRCALNLIEWSILFDPDEVASERTVIISERRAENEPRFWLAEEVQATSFKVHPYHHDTIGWKIDLRT
jgi:zinc protease